MIRHLCDVLNKVLAEGESAAYEPHGNYMMGQRHDILVESRQFVKKIKIKKMVKVNLSIQEYMLLVYGYSLGRVSIGERDGKHADILLGYKVAI